MNKKSRLMLVVSGGLLITVVLFLWQLNSQKQTRQEPLPRKVVVPTREPEPTWFSDTGALYISPTDDQYVEERLIADLRNKCPLENDIFLASYNYSTNKFQFRLKDKKNGMTRFDSWLEATGYNQISREYIEILE